ncbi:MAG: tRNA pseudouridine(55) synthase TruB [Clostridia bacterium]|nr:tRNA pseudouridine(55) synthase TruB [Clostridia bacterium]
MQSGILIIDKPEGMTSHDVVAKVRKALHTKKVGHTGTLDPLATGVLVVCVEKATKLVQYLTCENKTYDVEMKLGLKTDTGDITGSVVETDSNIENILNEISDEKIHDVLESFIGAQKQVPPMYSAIKVNGKKLYELAREGIEIEREARDIEIHEINNVFFENDILKFTVSCSKGTYVRSLCEDIASKLGTCGTMTNLRRIVTGEFDLKDSIKIEEISEEKIIPMEKLFDKKIDVKDVLKKLINGEEIKVDLEDGLYNLYSDEYLGIGKVKGKRLKREIIL